MDTASSSGPASNAGYGAGQPHASLSRFHDRESFVAAIAATFGEPDPTPAPASQISDTQAADLPTEIAAMIDDAEGGAAARSAGAPPLDLIEGHNSQQTRILLKTETYPSGGRRVLIRQVSVEGDAVIVGGTPKRNKREKSEQERVDSSVQRTRKTIRQRCMAFKADRLLTLTYRENMEDRERAYRDTTAFIQRARSAGYLVKYVAVPEQQKRGAWHVHIACRGFMWVQTLRRIWRGIVGQDNGNIDLSYRHRGESNPWRIAGYLSKYIGKAIEQAQPGERTFWASEWGGQEPIERVRLLPPGIQFTQVLTIVGDIFEKKRERGDVAAIDWWMPRAGPPLFVYWAA